MTNIDDDKQTDTPVKLHPDDDGGCSGGGDDVGADDDFESDE